MAAMRTRVRIGLVVTTIAAGLVLLIATSVGKPAPTMARPARPATAPATKYIANDSHLHLTNYIQEGPELTSIVPLMGDKIGRAALFGIPLQQQWSYRSTGSGAPTYYLESDADLYYYSFTDAYIATQFRALPKAMQARFDPMITGFNPADMYAADHVKRVLETYPGVFVGIGEFSIHKEFVTSKVAGEAPSITDPALDRLFDFCAEVGLVVLVHCDADTPFPKPGKEPAYVESLLAQFREHPKTSFIWAHMGLGRVIRPFPDMGKLLEKMLDDPSLRHVNVDLSWTEVAKYLTSTPQTPERLAALIKRHPDRFLFGTDEVGPTNQHDYLRILGMYDPLWKLLPPDVTDQVRLRNYERVFDNARTNVRAWEASHRKGGTKFSAPPPAPATDTYRPPAVPPPSSP
jgi:predicted TIM-barrel fold metal-dependent hydrolase